MPPLTPPDDPVVYTQLHPAIKFPKKRSKLLFFAGARRCTPIQRQLQISMLYGFSRCVDPSHLIIEDCNTHPAGIANTVCSKRNTSRKQHQRGQQLADRPLEFHLVAGVAGVAGRHMPAVAVAGAPSGADVLSHVC